MTRTSLIEKMFQTPGRKKELDDLYFKKMFPFGVQQQQWENDIIGKLIDDEDRIPSVKYVNFIRKEMYADGIAKEDDYLNNKDFKKLLKRMKITEEERLIIERLSKMETETCNFEQLPTLQQIKDCLTE